MRRRKKRLNLPPMPRLLLLHSKIFNSQLKLERYQLRLKLKKKKNNKSKVLREIKDYFNDIRQINT
jgi:hypothetical protein